MSLILEALRKSEAERRRTQVPNLFTPAPPLPAPPRRRSAWPWALAGLAMLAAVLAWQWPRRQPPDPAFAAHEPNAAQTVRTTIARPPTAVPVERPTPFAAEAISASSPPVAAAIAAPAAFRAPAASLSTLPHTSAPTAATAGVSAAPSAPDPASSPSEALPSLATLAGAERGALPALKITMHVWAEEPAARFAIVDGQRVTEGSTVAGAVVAEIRRDGIVLETDGRRVLLGKP